MDNIKCGVHSSQEHRQTLGPAAGLVTLVLPCSGRVSCFKHLGLSLLISKVGMTAWHTSFGLVGIRIESLTVGGTVSGTQTAACDTVGDTEGTLVSKNQGEHKS